MCLLIVCLFVYRSADQKNQSIWAQKMVFSPVCLRLPPRLSVRLPIPLSASLSLSVCIPSHEQSPFVLFVYRVGSLADRRLTHCPRMACHMNTHGPTRVWVSMTGATFNISHTRQARRWPINNVWSSGGRRKATRKFMHALSSRGLCLPYACSQNFWPRYYYWLAGIRCKLDAANLWCTPCVVTL